ncbi:tetratricopeptide repeat protein [Spirosoma utsteinense]|uniref:Tetratricopeptide (TPR) repeat protein n=1 Tax=Spirosoma utsteinense TaxID=2585773 RepID=A0ABR6WAW0_9BACT|nr:tetratricopeptide repeat protein [Spirosoma utsteinense]MBC3787385.1 tetratricopeptide (TPR) repeat protein [Spirosoma utsteinense]MBC3793060.1 tetratricopeptide (TPR) repeat protein [Spirosoma utsteinense]
MAKKKQPTGSGYDKPGQERQSNERPVRPVAPKPTTMPASGSGRSIPVRATDPSPRSTSTPSTSPDLPIEARPVLWWPPLVLALLGSLLYINTFGHQYALDDIAAIGQNLFVKKGIAGIPDLLRTEFWHFSNISLGYYRPLSLITFALEQEYFKDSPHISHMINAGLYGLTGLVIGVLLQKWLYKQTIPAFLIGLVFIAHPLHTEIVANIKGRDEILSFLFISLMLLSYWRYLETKQVGWTIGACLSLYLAFLSKESSIVSLALIPAMQYWFARQNVWQSLISLWPFLIVAALFFYQKKVMIGTLSGNPPVDWANYPYAIEKTQKSTMFKFLTYYIRLLVLPHPLVYDYSYNVIPSGSKGDLLTWTGFFGLLAMIWLSWKGFVKRTLWGFGLFWFFVTMAPGLGFIWFRGGILAERFTYAAVMGFGFVLIWALQRLLVRAQANADTKPMLVRYAPLLGLMAVVTGLYSFKTVERNRDWENNFVLFNSALPHAPNSCQVQRHVANEWIEKGLKDRTRADSIANAVNLIKPKPSVEQVKKGQILIDSSLAHANKHGRWALDHLQESTRIYPNFGEAYFSMAYVFQKITPNVDSAKYYYKQTIRAASAYAPAYNNLGVIYQGEGLAENNRQKLELASYYYNQSMIVNPAYVDGQNNRASLLKATGLDVRSLPDSLIRKY